MFTHVSEERAASLLRLIEAAHSSETSLNIYQTTWRHIPEDSNLYSIVFTVSVFRFGHSQFTTQWMWSSSTE
jgi:hypothetical protein